MHARWRGDGRELFFLSDDGVVMVAAAIPGPIPAFEAPTRLFQGPEAPAFSADRFSVTENGQRFLLAEVTGGEDDIAALMVLLNWNALRRE